MSILGMRQWSMSGPYVQGGAALNWLTSASSGGSPADNSGWSGYTLRQKIAASAISNFNGAASRVTIAASNTLGGLQLGAAYIGKAATSGDQYDFAVAPTQLLWSGSAGLTLAQGASAVSDGAGWAPASGDDVLISLYFSGATAIRTGVASGWQSYYKLANDPATIDTSGYTSFNAWAAVTLLETSH